MTTDTFTTTTTWTCPTGVISATIRCWGGGGAGGSTAATLGCRGGGAAGGCFASVVVSVTPGNVYTVTVGASKAGGSIASGRSTAASNAGNDTWFDSVSTVLAKGGVGGTPSTSGAAVGATATTTGCVGTTLFKGGNGAAATTTTSGAGGSGAGTTGNGNNGSGVTGGAAKSLSGGAGAAGQTAQSTNLSGFGGSVYGGGGGGSAASTGSPIAVSGGAGAAGRIEIEYTVSPDANPDAEQPSVTSTSYDATVTVGAQAEQPSAIGVSNAQIAGLAAIAGIPAAVGTASGPMPQISFTGTDTVGAGDEEPELELLTAGSTWLGTDAVVDIKLAEDTGDPSSAIDDSTIDASVSDSDTSTALDAGGPASAGVASDDTGSVVEANTLTIIMETVDDTVTATENVSAFRVSGATDTVTGSESIAIDGSQVVEDSDTGVGTEGAGQTAVSDGDSMHVRSIH